MKQFYRVILPLAVAGAVLTTGMALAADLPSAAPPPAPPLAAPTWEGLYGGTFLGGAVSTFKLQQSGTRDASQGGYTTGAFLGYNWQSGHVVYGIEGDLGVNNIKGNSAAAAGLIRTHDESLYSAALRARLGYDFGNLLPYFAFGGAMNESGVAELTVPNIGEVHRQYGYTLGAGLDWRLTVPYVGPIIIRGEYVYEGYGAKTYDVGPSGPLRARQDTSLVRIGLIYVPGQGLWSPQPIANNAVNWSGAYAGVLGGGSWDRARTNGAPSFSASGGLGGIYTGRNFMIGKWVVGAEGATEIGSVTGNGFTPNGGVIDSTKFHENVKSDVRIRAGYAFDRLLPFLAGGLAFGISDQQDLATGSEKARIAPLYVTIGGGLDYRLNEKWSVRAEYLYETSATKEKTNLNGCACKQEQSSQQARFGLAYHFE